MAVIDGREINSQNSFQGRGALSRYESWTYDRCSGLVMGIFVLSRTNWSVSFVCLLQNSQYSDDPERMGSEEFG